MNENTQDIPQRKLGWMVLFTTIPTLFCCALPIAFVTLGFGASWVSLYASIPVIGMVAANKIWFFAISGFLLAIAFWLTFRPNQTCPTDPKLARYCEASQVWNKRLLFMSLLIWTVGFVAAYLSVPLMEILGD